MFFVFHIFGNNIQEVIFLSEYIFEFLTFPLFVLPFLFVYSIEKKSFYAFLWVSFFISAIIFAIFENGILAVGTLLILSQISLFSQNALHAFSRILKSKAQYSIVVGKDFDKSTVLLFDGEKIFEIFVLEQNAYTVGKIVKNTGGMSREVSCTFLQHRRRS